MKPLDTIEKILAYIKHIALKLWTKLKFKINSLTSEDFISIGKLGYYENIKRYDETKSSLKTFIYQSVYFEIIHAIQDDSLFKLHHKDRKIFWKKEKIQAVMLNENIPWTDALMKIMGYSREEAEKFPDFNLCFVELDLELIEC